MGFLEKIRKGLSKTKQAMSHSLGGLFGAWTKNFTTSWRRA